jgi:hypothetical protein
METFQVEDWELARSNILSWASDLSSAPPTKELRTLRNRIYELGRRIDDLTLPPVQDDEPETPEEEGVQEEIAPVADDAADEEEDDEGPELIENDFPVRLLLFYFFIKY